MTMTKMHRTRAMGLMNLPGPLMLAIMGALWQLDQPREFMGIHRTVCHQYKPVAITTTSATLGRLVERGYVVRDGRGLYRAAISRDDLIARIATIIERA